MIRQVACSAALSAALVVALVVASLAAQTRFAQEDGDSAAPLQGNSFESRSESPAGALRAVRPGTAGGGTSEAETPAGIAAFAGAMHAGDATRGPGETGGATDPAAAADDSSSAKSSDDAPADSGVAAESSDLYVEVLDLNGDAVIDARVRLTGPAGVLDASSDTGGVAVFEGIPAGAYRPEVALGENDWRRGAEVVVAPAEWKAVTVRVTTASFRLRGRAIDDGGRPLADVAIRIDPAPAAGPVIDLLLVDAGGTGETTSASDGTFALDGIAAASVRVTGVWVLTAQERTRTVSLPGDHVELVFRSPTPVTVCGVAQDDVGAPLAGVHVAVVRTSDSALTAADGTYCLETDGGALLTFIATHEDHASDQKTVRIGRDDSDDRAQHRVDFVLRPNTGEAALEGYVTDTDGNPVPGESIHLDSLRASAHRSATTGPDGSYFFEELAAADDWAVSIFPRERYENFRAGPLRLEDGDVVRLDPVLEPRGTGSVFGTLQNAEGEPLPGFAFRISSLDNPARAIAVVSAADGSFAAEDVPAGRLIFDTSVSPVCSVRGLELAAGEEKRVELVFGIGSVAVSGTVRRTDGRPAAGARVVLSWSRSMGETVSASQFTTTADERGRYEFDPRLPPGSYRVMFTPTPGAVEHASRELLAVDEEWDFTPTAASAADSAP